MNFTNVWFGKIDDQNEVGGKIENLLEWRISEQGKIANGGETLG